MEVKFGEAHTELTIQHLEYGSVIGGSLIAPYSILKVCEAARASSFPLLKEICEENGENYSSMFFIKWLQLEIFPEFYNRQMTSSDAFTYIDFASRKIRVYHHFLPVGKSSQFVEDTATDMDTGVPLFYTSVLTVNVDPTTRRPSPFPASFKNHFTPEICDRRIKLEGKLPPRCQEPFSLPNEKSKIFIRSATITVRQIDRNKHANHVVYGDLCYDCLGDAFAQSVFGDLGSIFDHNIRRMSFLYLDECSLGDKIDTIVWQDQNELLVFKFHIKKGSVIVCQAEFQLFNRNLREKSRL